MAVLQGGAALGRGVGLRRDDAGRGVGLRGFLVVAGAPAAPVAVGLRGFLAGSPA